MRREPPTYCLNYWNHQTMEDKGKGAEKKDRTRMKGVRIKKKYEKEYELVKDYLIPVVQLMKVEGKTHTEAFQLVDKNLGVPRGCASSGAMYEND